MLLLKLYKKVLEIGVYWIQSNRGELAKFMGWGR
jgi:hypothetical protein